MVVEALERRSPREGELSYQKQYGDVAAANRWAANFWHGYRGSPQHLMETQRLTDQIKALERSVENDPELEANIVISRHKRVEQVLDNIVGINRSDEYQTNLVRAAIRIALSFETAPLAVYSDYDGTLSDSEAATLEDGAGIKHKGYPLSPDIKSIAGLNGEELDPHAYSISPSLRLIPGSILAERLLEEHGREYFLEIYSGIWSPLQKEREDLFRGAGRFHTLRKGTDGLFKYLKTREAEVEVLSANMTPVVEGALEQVPSANGILIRGIKPDDVTSMAKSLVIRQSIIEKPNRNVVFLGDGSTDKGLVDDPTTSEAVTIFFALKGAAFEKELRQHQRAGKLVCFLPYDNMEDVRKSLCQINNLAGQFRENLGSASIKK